LLAKALLETLATPEMQATPHRALETPGGVEAQVLAAVLLE
jgi:hypothetical protein